MFFDGKDGKDGRDGRDGRDGNDGRDGGTILGGGGVVPRILISASAFSSASGFPREPVSSVSYPHRKR